MGGGEVGGRVGGRWEAGGCEGGRWVQGGGVRWEVGRWEVGRGGGIEPHRTDRHILEGSRRKRQPYRTEP